MLSEHYLTVFLILITGLIILGPLLIPQNIIQRCHGDGFKVMMLLFIVLSTRLRTYSSGYGTVAHSLMIALLLMYMYFSSLATPETFSSTSVHDDAEEEDKMMPPEEWLGAPYGEEEQGWESSGLAEE